MIVYTLSDILRCGGLLCIVIILVAYAWATRDTRPKD